jgi:hypothetical protein
MDPDLDARTRSVLAESGLDLCEYLVLGCAYYESPAPRSEFASFAASLDEGDPRGTFELRDYEATLERLLKRGLLVLVDAANTREHSAELPALELNDVVFSRGGYDLYLRVVRQIFGDILTPKPFNRLGVS